MNLPEPDRYSIRELAKKWDKEESYIEQLIERDIIQAEVDEGNGRDIDPAAMKEWERCKRLVPSRTGIFPWVLGSRIIIQRSEVERLESGQNQQTENHREFRERRIVIHLKPSLKAAIRISWWKTIGQRPGSQDQAMWSQWQKWSSVYADKQESGMNPDNHVRETLRWPHVYPTQSRQSR